MKNAFEKIGAITDKDGKNFETLLTSKHAGTLASISDDIDSRQKITDLNARQAQEWTEDGVTLHANLTDKEKEILKKAIKLRKNIEQADVPFRVSFETKLPFISFDKENINLNISDVLSNLTEKIRQNKQENKGTSLINLPQEEILTMCASG